MPNESAKIGWSLADRRVGSRYSSPSPGWNAAAGLVQGAWRIPVEGLAIDCGRDDRHERSYELARVRGAAPGARGRAVVIAPARPSDTVDVLLLLHGNNLGWRRRATGEAPRDLARDRVAAQLAVLHGEGIPVVAVLPQGSVNTRDPLSRFGALDADAYIAEALAVARRHPGVGALDRVRDVVVGGHSGGGVDLSHLLPGRGGMRAPSRLRGVLHFDAINYRGAEPADHWRWASSLLAEQLAALQGLGTDAQHRYLDTSCGLVAWHTAAASTPDGYAVLYAALRARIDEWFRERAAAIGAAMAPAVQQRWRQRFVVERVSGATHDNLLSARDNLATGLRRLLRAP